MMGRAWDAAVPAWAWAMGSTMGRSRRPARRDAGIGLKPDRHIAGFSIRKEDGTEIPLIFEAGVGRARDTVVLKLAGAVPPKAALWYGYGLDPYCNLTDGMDMAVPVFGPIPLDDIAGTETTAADRAAHPLGPRRPTAAARPGIRRARQGPDHHRR